MAHPEAQQPIKSEDIPEWPVGSGNFRRSCLLWHGCCVFRLNVETLTTGFGEKAEQNSEQKRIGLVFDFLV